MPSLYNNLQVTGSGGFSSSRL